MGVFISVLLTHSGLDLIKRKHTDGVSLFHFLHACAIVSTSEKRGSFFYLFFCFSTPLRIPIKMSFSFGMEAGTAVTHV